MLIKLTAICSRRQMQVDIEVEASLPAAYLKGSLQLIRGFAG